VKRHEVDGPKRSASLKQARIGVEALRPNPTLRGSRMGFCDAHERAKLGSVDRAALYSPEEPTGGSRVGSRRDTVSQSRRANAGCASGALCRTHRRGDPRNEVGDPVEERMGTVVHPALSVRNFVSGPKIGRDLKNPYRRIGLRNTSPAFLSENSRSRTSTTANLKTNDLSAI
jgi:hypothetical protein